MTQISTNPESAEEVLLEAMETRFGQIDGSTVPTGDTLAYGTTLNSVERGFVDLNVAYSDTPKLWLAVSDLEVEDHRPSKQVRTKIVLSVVGAIHAPHDTSEEKQKIQSRVNDLFFDVRRAVYSEWSIGGKANYVKLIRVVYDEGMFFPRGFFFSNWEAVLDVSAARPDDVSF